MIDKFVTMNTTFAALIILIVIGAEILSIPVDLETPSRLGTWWV